MIAKIKYFWLLPPTILLFTVPLMAQVLESTPNKDKKSTDDVGSDRTPRIERLYQMVESADRISVETGSVK